MIIALVMIAMLSLQQRAAANDYGARPRYHTSIGFYAWPGAYGRGYYYGYGWWPRRGYNYPGAPYYQGYGPPYYQGYGPPYYPGYGPPYYPGYGPPYVSGL
jgi:hypothetical protein